MLHANFEQNNPQARGLMTAQANSETVVQQVSAAVSEMKAAHRREIAAVEAELARQSSQIAAMTIGGGGGTDLRRSPGNLSNEGENLASFARTGNFSASMSTDSSGSGGYFVSPVVSDQIQLRQFAQSSLARLARHVTIATGDSFEEVWDMGDPGVAWVGEREARPATDTANLRLLTTNLNEVYCLQPITQRLLDDSAYDLGTWLAGRVADKLGRAAGQAFITGNGVNQPRGLSTYTISADIDSARAWGVIQGVYTGASGAFSANPADVLVDAVYALSSEYRAGASWIMNSKTAGAVRKMKDGDGRFLWSDSLVQGQPPMMLGYPVYLDEYAPDIAASTAAIWFGDFSRAYLIVDRPGLRLLRDPYTSKPNVLFYVYQRIGGALVNSEAVKAVVFGS